MTDWNCYRRPRVCVCGLSLGLYEEAMPGYMERLKGQFHTLIKPVSDTAELVVTAFCYQTEHVNKACEAAVREDVDLLLLLPMSYTASRMTTGPVLENELPLLIWDTQHAKTIDDDYDFGDLLMNHAAQGTQDLTNVLWQAQRSFGYLNGHFDDPECQRELKAWLQAAATARRGRRIRVGSIGEPFAGMGDFEYDADALTSQWGPKVVDIPLTHLADENARVSSEALESAIIRLNEHHMLAPELGQDVLARSMRLGLALERVVVDKGVDALTLNFMAFAESDRVDTLPFLGVNQLMARGLGYAGEGDVLRAALAAQLATLGEPVTFTEIYTVDYVNQRMLMTHMQECNPAMAHRAHGIQIIERAFWAPGISPYAGMVFNLSPGPVTLVTITPTPNGGFRMIAGEATVPDTAPFPNLPQPHWLAETDGPVDDWLTQYNRAGGPHHLVAIKGRHQPVLKKLAEWQGFEWVTIP